jgi:catechol 2,3-dioxygenase-like lactoylglutathione lyase family enzyme
LRAARVHGILLSAPDRIGDLRPVFTCAEETRMVKGFAHICFSVKDLDSAIAFYQGKLGLRHAFDFINDRGKRFGVYLHIGGRSFIELFQGEVGAPPEKPAYKHFCLEVDDIEKTAASLRAQGVEVTPVQKGSDQSWQAWLADPDGNRIELHAYTEQSKQQAALK